MFIMFMYPVIIILVFISLRYNVVTASVKPCSVSFQFVESNFRFYYTHWNMKENKLLIKLEKNR